MLLGSEGILGVITEAWVRAAGPARASSPPAGVALRRLRGRARRRCARSRRPASTRPTAACSTRSRPSSPGAGDRTEGAAGARVRVGRPSGRRVDGPRARAAPRTTAASPARATRPTARATARTPVGAWRSAFLRAPYLRDTFVACGVLSDTFETAITWDRFADFHASVMARRREQRGPRGLRRRRAVSCRFTHVYPDGPAPYFTVLAPARRGVASSSSGTRSRPRAVGGGDRGRRDDHPPPRGRPRPPAVVRPPAPGAVRRGAAGGEGGARSRRRSSTPGVLIDP